MCPTRSVFCCLMIIVPILSFLATEEKRIFAFETYIWIGFGTYFIRSHPVDPVDAEIGE